MTKNNSSQKNKAKVPETSDELLKTQSFILDNIMADLPGFVYWKNISSVYMGCNNNLALESGLKSREEIMGKTDYDFAWGKLQADLFVEDDREVIHLRKKKVSEYKIPSDFSEKPYRYIRTEKSPLLYKDNVIGVLAIAVDISHEKEAEELRLNKQETEKKLQETLVKLDAMTLVASSIGHELRNPLITISSGIRAIKGTINQLIENHIRSKELTSFELIDPSELNITKITFEDMLNETRSGLLFIEMLLMNLNSDSDIGDTESMSMLHCLQEAVTRYPFDTGQLEKIEINDKNDFTVKGKKLLMIHVFFNLLKNSLYYIKKSNKPDAKISIWIENDNQYNRLNFKDTGTGIASDILPHIFEKFFTKTHHGAGIGLAFCKMVIESVGGTIICESIDHDYTQIIMCFPKEGAELPWRA